MSRGKLYTGGRLNLNLPMTVVQTMERVRIKREGRMGLPSAAADIYREALARGLAQMEAEEDATRPNNTSEPKMSKADADAARRQLAHPILLQEMSTDLTPWDQWRAAACSWAEDTYKDRTMGRHIALAIIDAWADGEREIGPRHLPLSLWGGRADRLPRAERIAAALKQALPPPTPLFGL
ncbi:MAG: hypothetical protein ACE366_28620 [Bradymonadia bacterium]